MRRVLDFQDIKLYTLCNGEKNGTELLPGDCFYLIDFCHKSLIVNTSNTSYAFFLKGKIVRFLIIVIYKLFYSPGERGTYNSSKPGN